MPRRKQTTATTRRELAPGARVFAYCRDSGGAGQEKSVPEQRQALAVFAREHGLTVAGWYEDTARASGDLQRREAFLELLSACLHDPPPVDGVLVYSFSRLFRDELDAGYYKSALRRHGVEILSATDQIPEGPFAYVIETVIDVANRLQLDRLSIEVRRGLRALVEAGYAPPGGSPPRGYRVERSPYGTRRDGTPRTAGKWVVDPELGPRVTLAFAMYAAGYNVIQIHAATQLYAAAGSSYASMFRNRSYLGIAKFGAEEFPAHHPALVDPATWAQVEARAMANVKFKPRGGSEFLLSGLLFCGACGRPMAGGVDMRNAERGRGRPWRYYRCHTAGCTHAGRVNATQLEGWVVDALLTRIVTPENVALWLAAVRAELDGAGGAARLAEVDAAIARLRKAIERLLDLVEDGDPGARERVRQRRAELAAREGERAELARRQAVAGPVTEGEIAAVVDALRAGLAAEDVDAARRAVRAFLARVEVLEDAVQLVYRVEDALGSTGVMGVPPRGFEQNSRTLAGRLD